MPFFAAQSAMGAVICGTVKLLLTMYGEALRDDGGRRAITIIGIFASVATGAVANASGVNPKPAMIADLVARDRLLGEALVVWSEPGGVAVPAARSCGPRPCRRAFACRPAPPPRFGGPVEANGRVKRKDEGNLHRVGGPRGARKQSARDGAAAVPAGSCVASSASCHSSLDCAKPGDRMIPATKTTALIR